MSTLVYVSNATPPVTTSITLPDDLLWRDEWGWNPVVHSLDQTLSGALIVETATRLAGRPVTLEGGQNYGWITRLTLAQVQALAAIEGAVMSLTLPGRSAMDVMFRLDQTAIEAHQILSLSEPGDDDPFQVTLSFMEV
jgi:hypothetical protein